LIGRSVEWRRTRAIRINPIRPARRPVLAVLIQEPAPVSRFFDVFSNNEIVMFFHNFGSLNESTNRFG
jgi:hypothetical protein